MRWSKHQNVIDHTPPVSRPRSTSAGARRGGRMKRQNWEQSLPVFRRPVTSSRRPGRRIAHAAARIAGEPARKPRGPGTATPGARPRDSDQPVPLARPNRTTAPRRRARARIARASPLSPHHSPHLPRAATASAIKGRGHDRAGHGSSSTGKAAADRSRGWFNFFRFRASRILDLLRRRQRVTGDSPGVE